MTLGEKLQALRRSRGLSQEQLAEALAVSRQAVSKWECGDSAPDLEKLRTICTYFGVTTDYLIWENAEDAPHGNTEAGRMSDHAARRESTRAFVRKNAHWAGYVLAIIGGALLARSLLSLLSACLLMGYTLKIDGVTVSDLLSQSMVGTMAKMLLPYLLLYAAMLAGGLLLARWLKKRNGESETHDDL